MHECIKKLLAGFQAPQQANVEQLIRLMSTAGAQLDSNHNATVYIDACSKLIARLSRDTRLATRLRYMLQASIQSCWSATGSQDAVGTDAAFGDWTIELLHHLPGESEQCRHTIDMQLDALSAWIVFSCRS